MGLLLTRARHKGWYWMCKSLDQISMLLALYIFWKQRFIWVFHSFFLIIFNFVFVFGWHCKERGYYSEVLMWCRRKNPVKLKHLMPWSHVTNFGGKKKDKENSKNSSLPTSSWEGSGNVSLKIFWVLRMLGCFNVPCIHCRQHSRQKHLWGWGVGFVLLAVFKVYSWIWVQRALLRVLRGL